GVLTTRAVKNVNLRHLFQVDAAHQRHGAVAVRACQFGCVGCGHGEFAHVIREGPGREVQFHGRDLALAEQEIRRTLGCWAACLGISVAFLWTKNNRRVPWRSDGGGSVPFSSASFWGAFGLIGNLLSLNGQIDVAALSSQLLWIGGMILFGLGALLLRP